MDEYMTDKQADTQRNDLLDLVIEKINRIITNPQEAAALIQEVTNLKH